MANDLIIRIPDVTTEVTISGKWIDERDALVTEAMMHTEVATDTQFQNAGVILKRLTKFSNDMENKRKDFGRPFREADKHIKAAADNAREPLETAKAALQQQMNAYAKEQQRLADEERRRIEKVQQEAIEAQAAQQQALVEAGLVDEAEEFAPVVPEIAPTVDRARSADVRVGETVVFEITDETLVPVFFKSIDEKKIREYMRTNIELKRLLVEGTQPLPGIEFKIETRVISR
jgi:hypothetical protein